ncbi:hypothetical protein GGH95_003730, partial [Coemansia sp. RSA 1836]
MPAARSARPTAVKRKALAETPISRQAPVALAGVQKTSAATLKSAFPVTKHSTAAADA